MFEFRNQAAEQRQRETLLPPAGGSGDFVQSAPDNGRIGGTRRGHKQTRMAGRDRRLFPVEQFLIQLLARSEPGEADFDVLIRSEPGKPDHLARHIDDFHRLTHVEDENSTL